MVNWIPASFFALVGFGLWGFFSKLAVNHIDFKSALIYQSLGVVLIGVLSLSLISFKPAGDVRGISFALLTGMAYGLGCLFYLLAVSKGHLVSVVTLTALYPMVTIVLAFLFLHEVVTLRQMVGVVCAIIAIMLM